MSIFNKGADQSFTNKLVEQINAVLPNNGGAIPLTAESANAMLSMEGFRNQPPEVVQSADHLSTALESIWQAVTDGKQGNLTVAQEQASILAIAGVKAPGRSLTRAVSEYGMELERASRHELTRVFSAVGIPGNQEQRRFAAEAYDEKQNRNAMTFSIAYNMNAARQDDFGEALFPTVTVTPENVGLQITMRLIYVYDEVQHQTNGALSDFNRKSIINAIRDSSILAVQQTQLVPIYRSSSPANPATDSAQYFYAGISPSTITLDKQSVQTAPLAFGAKFNLLGISQTPNAVNQGLEDQTDAVDPSARLAKLYFKLVSGGTTEFFAVDVSDMPTSDFNASVQANTQRLTLQFNTRSIAFVAGMKTTAGAASTILNTLGTTTVRLNANVSGYIVRDRGETQLTAAQPDVYNVYDNAGNVLSTASGAGATSAGLFADSTKISLVGFDLLAYRTNSNRRNRGKLLDTQYVNYLYTVPLLPPITQLRPAIANDSNDGEMLSNLITATRIQISNAAVTKLLAVDASLAVSATLPDVASLAPEVFGVASLIVPPTYSTTALDVSAGLDSLTDSARIDDVQALLMNTIRDVAISLFVNSGFGPASAALYEGAAPKPVLIIACDPIIGRYLQLNGDTRYAGEMFDYKIVVSYDNRMAGKLFLTFGAQSSFNSGVPNPLHFGSMAWKAELVTAMPMVRNGAQSMELTVSPSFRHIVNLPVLGKITVSNLSTVIAGKVTVNVSK